MRRLTAVVVVLSVFALATPEAIDASPAKKKKRGARPTPTATPRRTPTPTPVPYSRAAGTCLEYVPGRYVIVAEVGESGRVFKLDAATELEVIPSPGARVRVLYVDEPDGPLAKRLLPGPAPPIQR